MFGLRGQGEWVAGNRVRLSWDDLLHRFPSSRRDEGRGLLFKCFSQYTPYPAGQGVSSDPFRCPSEQTSGRGEGGKVTQHEALSRAIGRDEHDQTFGA